METFRENSYGECSVEEMEVSDTCLNYGMSLSECYDNFKSYSVSKDIADYEDYDSYYRVMKELNLA